MAAMQLYQFGNQLVALAERSQRSHELGDLPERLSSLKDRINAVAWDGQWYTRAYTDDNRPLGSSKSPEGQLFLNPQSWSVYSGVADGGRGNQAMDAVFERLNSDVGIKLLDPPFTQFPTDVGSVIHYPAGLKENAGIFCHANTWAIIAECLLKRADRAMQYYTQILPPRVSQAIGHERYRVEPYVYCQFITGPDHPNHGAASHAWLTGTSVWSFVAFTQYILGIRPVFDGLLVDPCIPSDWKTYTIDRRFRGAMYRITVRNPNGCTHGVGTLLLNGQKLASSIIPPQAVGSIHDVVATLG